MPFVSFGQGFMNSENIAFLKGYNNSESHKPIKNNTIRSSTSSVEQIIDKSINTPSFSNIRAEQGIKLTSEQDYCIPVYETGCEVGDGIDDLVLIGVNGTSIEDLNTGCSPEAYEDRTNERVDLNASISYPVSIKSNASGDVAVLWIDFNDNGIFEDTEMLGWGELDGENNNAEIDLNIPADANLGEHRFRVMIQWRKDPASFDPCAPASSWGEVRDYTVNVLEVPSCLPTSNLKASNLSDSSALITWTPGSDETNWEIEYGEFGFNLGEGTVIKVSNTPQALINELPSNTKFEAYVTAICNEDNVSSTIGPVRFRTLPEGADCGQVQVTNNFENGLFNEKGGQVVADDFFINPSTTMNIYQISANILNEGGISSANLVFYEDVDGHPGEEIQRIEGLNPVSQEIIGSLNDYDVSEMVLDLTDQNISFSNDSPNEAKAYWISFIIIPNNPDPISHHGAAIDFTTMEVIGNTQYFAVQDGAEWSEANKIQDGVFSILSECVELGVESHDFDSFTFYPNPVENTLNLQAKMPIKDIQLYNLIGQQVLNVKLDKSDGQIDLDGIQTGIYIMGVNINESYKTFRIIKK